MLQIEQDLDDVVNATQINGRFDAKRFRQIVYGVDPGLNGTQQKEQCAYQLEEHGIPALRLLHASGINGHSQAIASELKKAEATLAELKETLGYNAKRSKTNISRERKPYHAHYFAVVGEDGVPRAVYA